jgi:mono/diheme cytochrome c family protein
MLSAPWTGEAPAQTLPGDFVSGRKLAHTVCVECHDVARDSFLSPNPDAPSFQAVADFPATTELSLRVFLQSPHRFMPNLILTGRERDDVISYILGLRGSKPRPDRSSQRRDRP